MAEESQQELRWTEYELRIAILQVLLGIRIKSPHYPPLTSVSVKDLSDILHLGSAARELFDPPLRWLLDGNFVEMSGELYDVTDKGIEYLKEELERLRVGPE